MVGAGCAVAAVLCFSLNDVAIKWLSDEYALHQVVLIRSTIGLAITLLVAVFFFGGLSALRTKRLGMHALRGLSVVFANMTFFLGLAALPLAEAVAIFFVSPLLISLFSVVFLGETVGPRRWAAIAVGLIGVIVILRPGTAAFQLAALLPLAAAFGYAALHTMTRRIGGTESALTMVFYIQIMFILSAALIGLGLGHGRFDVYEAPSSGFLFRAWAWPDLEAWAITIFIGVIGTLAGFLISQAYRVAESAVVAPFEYVAMPMAVMWGAVLFGEWPDLATWIGIALILGSGLFLIWREAQAKIQPESDAQ